MQKTPFRTKFELISFVVNVTVIIFIVLVLISRQIEVKTLGAKVSKMEKTMTLVEERLTNLEYRFKG